MSQFLPLFPLGLVVYPGEFLKLHIFEERYQQLIRESLLEGRAFGVPTVLEGVMPGMGTEVIVSSLERDYPTGEMDITTQGVRVFQIEEFNLQAPGKLYPGGQITYPEEDRTTDEDLGIELMSLITQFDDILGISRPHHVAPGNLLSWAVAHQIGMNLRQEYEVLTLPTERQRLEYLIHHLKQVIPIVIETERAKSRAKLNGHFKNVVPPEY